MQVAVFSSYLKIGFFEVQLFYNVALTSAGQQNDSIIHGYTFFFMFFSIMVYHSISNGLSCLR